MSSLPATAAQGAEQNALTADWALFSKVPGHKTDYEVLASTMDAGVATRFIRSLLTAHTDDQALGRPEQLPWCSVTGQPGDRAAFVFMELAWSPEKDGTNQPITPARLMVVDWATAADRMLTFRRMAEAFYLLGWTDIQAGPPGYEGRKAGLTIRPGDFEEIAREIDSEFGLDFVAGIATLILEGKQVVLTAAAYPSLPDRVRFLDAVFALLPYAQRAHLSASTWASYRIRHKVRLTFAERPAEGQTEVALDRRTVAEPATTDGLSYLRTLHNLRLKGRTTTHIVRHLAGLRDPRLCATAADAVSLLLAMDVTEAVQQRIRTGVATVAEVHGVLAQYTWDGLDHDDMRHDYRRFLIDRTLSGQADAQDAWNALNATWTEYVRNGLSRRAYELLTAGNLGTLEQLARIVDTRAGAKADLVRNLTDAVTHDPQPDHIALYTRFLGTVSGDIAADESIHGYFLARARAGVQMVMGLATLDLDRLVAVLQVWQRLVTDDSRWVRPVLMAATGDVSLAGKEDFAALRDLRPDGPLAVVGIAAYRGHLPAVVAGPWGLVADIAADVAAQNHPHRPVFQSHLEPLRSWITSGRAQWTDVARVDVLCLMAGVPAPGFGYQLNDVYLQELGRCWRSQASKRVRHELRIQLSQALRPRAAGDQGYLGINELIRIVDEVDDPGLREWAARWVSAYLREHLDQRPLIRWGEEWLQLVEPHWRALDQLAALCRADSPARPIGEALVPLLDFPPGYLFDILRPWLLPERESRVLELICRLRSGPEEARRFAVEFQRHASDPGLCREFGPRFSEFMARFGPVLMEVVKDFRPSGRGRERDSPNLLQRAKGVFHRSGPDGPPTPTNPQQPGFTAVEGNR